MNPHLCFSILNIWYPHHGPYEQNYPYLWSPFDPISPSWTQNQSVKMQVLESKDFFKHKNSLRLQFGHKWLTHFGCANGFSELCHAFFGWCFFSWCDTY
jgi:hypothetical protein